MQELKNKHNGRTNNEIFISPFSPFFLTYDKFTFSGAKLRPNYKKYSLFLSKSLKRPQFRVGFCVVIKAFILTIILLISSARAESPNEKIDDLIRGAPSDKITYFSAYFLGYNSTLGPLGEGNLDIFDKDPLFSFSDFDCTTFVETILALTFSKDLDSFYSNLINIRYKDGKISFKNRNHFISVDWIPNNTKLGFLEDVTTQIGPSNLSKTMIDKKGWYEKLNISILGGQDNLSVFEKEELLKLLKSEGKEFSPVLAQIPYINIAYIIDHPQVLDKIPNGSILNIVRDNWDLSSTIGTHLDVSHQGFAIRKNKILFYRHASLEFGKILDVPLLQYLEKYLGGSVPVGINIQKIPMN